MPSLTGNIRVYVYLTPTKNLNSCINQLFYKRILINGSMDSSDYVDPPDSDLLYHDASFISEKDTLKFSYRIQKEIDMTEDYKDKKSETKSWFAILFYKRKGDSLYRSQHDLSRSEKKYFLEQLEKVVIPELDDCAGAHEVRAY
jgi:hypothetical protein